MRKCIYYGCGNAYDALNDACINDNSGDNDINSISFNMFVQIYIYTNTNFDNVNDDMEQTSVK